jgi:hypothetical protein
MPLGNGVIMTPETVKRLEARRDELIKKRIELAKERRRKEQEEKALARSQRVRETLEKTGLYYQPIITNSVYNDGSRKKEIR